MSNTKARAAFSPNLSVKVLNYKDITTRLVLTVMRPCSCSGVGWISELSKNTKTEFTSSTVHVSRVFLEVA